MNRNWNLCHFLLFDCLLFISYLCKLYETKDLENWLINWWQSIVVLHKCVCVIYNIRSIYDKRVHIIHIQCYCDLCLFYCCNVLLFFFTVNVYIILTPLNFIMCVQSIFCLLFFLSNLMERLFFFLLCKYKGHKCDCARKFFIQTLLTHTQKEIKEKMYSRKKICVYVVRAVKLLFCSSSYCYILIFGFYYIIVVKQLREKNEKLFSITKTRVSETLLSYGCDILCLHCCTWM